jgi:hypothetical protein
MEKEARAQQRVIEPLVMTMMMMNGVNYKKSRNTGMICEPSEIRSRYSSYTNL